MANRPKQNRAEQSDSPNTKVIEPARGGIHGTVGGQFTRDNQGDRREPHPDPDRPM
ncbi:MAG TPA: hypothetical protein VD902_14885 [Symbiobacteriaceae bacterium]|nr:hypothetical protein [Symbiobacteriaceae bacterium]